MASERNIRLEREGLALVMIELLKRSIDVIPVSNTWSFDLITATGKKLEVKRANPTQAKGRNNMRYETFAYHFKGNERKVADFAILIANMPTGNVFYVIPIEDITGESIRFHPDKHKSKYDQYRDRWELLD